MTAFSSFVTTGATHQSIGGNNNKPYVVSNYIDLSEVAAEAAIAQGDTIQAIAVPAGSYVQFAGLQVMEVMTGTSTDATLDFGVTGGDVDAWVDGFDLDGAAAGAYAAAATASITPAQTFFASADTLDILVATQTGTITGGVIRAFAVICPVADLGKAPGIAQLGS